MNIGIPVSVFFMFLMLILIVYSLQSLLNSPQVGLVLPGVDYPGSPVYVPFAYGIIALATVMVIHEFGHGILARVDGIRIKSIGVLLLAILPGAFVEPNEEDIKKSGRMTKLRIYSAGSIFNLGLAAVSLIIFLLISAVAIGGVGLGIPGFTVPGTSIKTQPVTILNMSEPVFPTFNSDGIQISSVVPGSPSYGKLNQGAVIDNINGISTHNTTQFQNYVSTLKVGDNVSIQTDQGSVNIIAAKNPNNDSAYMGIRVAQNFVVDKNVVHTYGTTLPWFLYDLSQLFFWIFLLNFAVGTFNLLPMKPLDGGLILEELLRSKISEKNVQRIMNPISYILILILVVSIVYVLGKGLLLSLNIHI